MQLVLEVLLLRGVVVTLAFLVGQVLHHLLPRSLERIQPGQRTMQVLSVSRRVAQVLEAV
jgi:hypothetical protein